MTEPRQLVCTICGAKRWTFKQMQDHIEKKHPPKDKK